MECAVVRACPRVPALLNCTRSNCYSSHYLVLLPYRFLFFLPPCQPVCVCPILRDTTFLRRYNKRLIGIITTTTVIIIASHAGSHSDFSLPFCGCPQGPRTSPAGLFSFERKMESSLPDANIQPKLDGSKYNTDHIP